MTSRSRLETARLLFESPVAADADAIFERYASDPEVTRYLGWPLHQTVDDTRRFLAFSAAQWDQRGTGPYLIRTKADGRLVGSTGLEVDAAGEAMTGYVLARDVWGQGFATEALQAMVDLARELGLSRVAALCHPDHAASRRVLQKCGFEHDRRRVRQLEFPNLAAGRLQDVVCYVLRIA